MRKLLLFALALTPYFAKAQVITFESLTLPGTDTFYINTLTPGRDAGFNTGLMHFPYQYDTSGSFGYWSGGFSYTNKKDSVTSGYTNMYSAKAARGNNGSDKYLTFTPGYAGDMCIKVAGTFSRFTPASMYVTNNTYAYNSMRDGDAIAKKFGGASGNDADWFKLVAHGYLNGAVKADSVAFYLADYRSATNTQDYIIKNWTLVDLTPLGGVDSMFFSLNSSDVGAFGMNTPAYFCMDDLLVRIPITGVSNVPAQSVAKVYPNPATDRLTVELKDEAIKTASVYDVTGKLIATQTVTGNTLTFNTATFANGAYLLKLEGVTGSASVRFVKQ